MEQQNQIEEMHGKVSKEEKIKKRKEKTKA